MKDIFKISIMLILVMVVYIYKDNISTFITDEIIYKGSNKVLTYNEYYQDYDYLYVQNIDTNSVQSYQEVLNMFYSIINSGDDNYTFYCDYNECLNDIKKLVKEKNTIANINNFVNPFNSFATINIDVNSDGKITVKNNKVYSNEQIDYIKSYINSFIESNISDSMNINDKIKSFHDFIVNNTIYDQDSNDKSYTAFNLITTGKSICGGYSDIMAIYLNVLGVKNYKITSEDHIWNLVNIDNKWYHLDATWDDPVSSDGKQYLIHNFFLIDTKQLLNLDKIEHNYNKEIYLEANL